MPKPKHTLTQRQAERAMAWFLKQMGLADWKVTVTVGKLRPDWVIDLPAAQYGTVQPFRPEKTATIWINLALHINGSDPIGTLFHEGMHIIMSDIDFKGDELGSAEYQWNKLGDLLAKAYRKGVR